MKRFMIAAVAVTALAGLANAVEVADSHAQEFQAIHGLGNTTENPQAPNVVAQLNREGLQKVAPESKTGGGSPGAPGGYQTVQPQCLTGFSRTELKYMHHGHIDRMTCLTPVIQCPKPTMPGINVGIVVSKVTVSPEDGRFKIEYKCTYTGTAG
ncbi:hypothetical protein [Pelagibius sp.]|uniref:hypothetical protein n=1 Tax=Pelagibius sp. TaxID=1931238 RepID=UPI002609A598|nr:hypothetical protein [Pelagibius sp.]